MPSGHHVQPVRTPVSALILGLVLIAVGIVGLIQLAGDPLLQDIDAGSADPGPAFFPRLMLMLLIAGGVGQVGIAAAGAWRTGGFARDPGFAGRRLLVPALLVASTAIYNAALPPFGYFAATLLFALLWLPVIGWLDGSLPRSRGAAVALVAVEAVALSAFLYAVFGYAIKVPLP